MPWIVAAAALGSGYMASRSAKKGAESQERIAQQQLEASKPISVTGMFGDVAYDAPSRTMDIGLSPELQEHYDYLFGRGKVTGEQIEAMSGDPWAMQQRIYGQQKALFAPQQERERLDLENRLRAQGMLTATGGQMRMGTLIEKQQMQDLARQIQALTQAQQIEDLYRAREAGDFQAALNIAELPLSYANVSRGVTGGLSRAAQYGAGLQSKAAMNVADTQSAFWGQLGKDIGSRDWGSGGDDWLPRDSGYGAGGFFSGGTSTPRYPSR